jgi:D-serine dehydratase
MAHQATLPTPNSIFGRPFSGWMKGMPDMPGDASSAEIGSMGLNVLKGSIPLPCAVLKESALRQNSAWMSEFVKKTGVKLCPHGKTTMSPELFQRQLDDGAWGITAATYHQLKVMRSFGIRRIFLANQLVDPIAIRHVAAELAADPDFDFYCLVDSVEGVAALSGAAANCTRPIQVLIELGQQGGRTGSRTPEHALQVARAVGTRPELMLVGLETYEYVVAGRNDTEREHNIAALFRSFSSLAQELDSQQLFKSPHILLSAGGSVFFDLAAAAMNSVTLSRPVLPIIRSGCYLTHDQGWLPDTYAKMRVRSEIAASIPTRPTAALEIWSYIQSRPEPTRALASMGKRDVSFDVNLPRPILHFRPGENAPRQFGDGTVISAMNDQHAYLDVPSTSPLQVGDMIASGISHPCTTFDKWRAILLTDDAYNVTGAISTYF